MPPLCSFLGRQAGLTPRNASFEIWGRQEPKNGGVSADERNQKEESITFEAITDMSELERCAEISGFQLIQQVPPMNPATPERNPPMSANRAICVLLSLRGAWSTISLSPATFAEAYAPHRK